MEDIDPLFLRIVYLCLFKCSKWNHVLEMLGDEDGIRAATAIAGVEADMENLRAILRYMADTDEVMLVRALKLDLTPSVRRAVERLAAEAML